MPATVVSSVSGWGVYFATALIFASVLSPTMNQVQEDSKVVSASKTVAGVQRVFDSLGPGLMVILTYGSRGEAAKITTGAHSVNYVSEDTAVSAVTKWPLSNFTLLPGVEYFAWISTGSVEVSRIGRS